MSLCLPNAITEFWLFLRLELNYYNRTIVCGIIETDGSHRLSL